MSIIDNLVKKHLNSSCKSVKVINEAIIFDLDGTLFDNRHRLIWHRVGQWIQYNSQVSKDQPIMPVFEALLEYQIKGYQILIWSARSESTRSVTESMLRKQGVIWTELRLRADGDYRTGIELKTELLHDYRKNTPDVTIVEAWDDNDDVLAMWRSNDILTTKVTLQDDVDVEDIKN